MIEPHYQNKLVTLYKGDCLEIMPELKEKFDVCITIYLMKQLLLNGI